MCFSEYILRVENLVACFCQPISMLLCSKSMQIDDRMHRAYEAKRLSLSSILQGFKSQSVDNERSIFLRYFEKSYGSFRKRQGFWLKNVKTSAYLYGYEGR